MVRNIKLSSLILKSSVLTFLIGSLFYSSLALAETNAGSVPDAATMLENFAATVPQFMQLVTALAYVMGMGLICGGLFKLKEFGEQRSMMSSQHDLKAPIALIVCGTALLYVPSSVQVGLQTFWKDPNPYGYVQATTDQWGTLYQDIFLVIQLIGTIAFIRGLLILSKMSHGQQNDMTKGLTYVIAGVMCINLYDFLNAVETTLGITNVVGS